MVRSSFQSVNRLWQFGQTVLGIIFRHPVTGASIVPVLPDGRIILVKRRDSGLWALPGGMVDWGEDIATTVQRELREETGLELVKINRLVGVYSAPDRDPRIHSISVLVEAEVKGEMQVRDTSEIIAVEAFEKNVLPTNLSYDYNRQMQDYFSGQTVLA